MSLQRDLISREAAEIPSSDPNAQRRQVLGAGLVSSGIRPFPRISVTSNSLCRSAKSTLDLEGIFHFPYNRLSFSNSVRCNPIVSCGVTGIAMGRRMERLSRPLPHIVQYILLLGQPQLHALVER